MPLPGLVRLCPLTLASSAVFACSDGGGEGMTLLGLVLFSPLTLTLTIWF